MALPQTNEDGGVIMARRRTAATLSTPQLVITACLYPQEAGSSLQLQYVYTLQCTASVCLYSAELILVIQRAHTVYIESSELILLEINISFIYDFKSVYHEIFRLLLFECWQRKYSFITGRF